MPRAGRPPKSETEKYQAVSIRLHPQVIAWAKAEAKKRGVGYQTIINEALLKLLGMICNYYAVLQCGAIAD